jgi:N-acetylglucosamine-6-phosphate deacetylase
MPALHLHNAQLVLHDSVRRGGLLINHGKITRVLTSNPRLPNTQRVDARGHYVAPGFVDLHIHGALGRDVMEGTIESFRTITEFHLRGGTTSLALTTLTSSREAIRKVLDTVEPVLNTSIGGSRIVGVHIEGPYVARKFAGAQDPDHIRDPDPAEWKYFLRKRGLVTQLTLTPERPGALALIRALRRRGIIASGGHTEATESSLFPAIRAGLNQATHVYNAMSTIVKNGPFREAGMIEVALANDEITCELICDGCHVPPSLMKLLFQAKNVEQVCLITDATLGAGLAVGTEFHMGSVGARVGKATCEMQDGTGFAGSILTMARAVRNAVELGHQTIPNAVRMASTNPARQLGRLGELGQLAPGARADLVAFDGGFKVRGVWLDGEQCVG